MLRILLALLLVGAATLLVFQRDRVDPALIEQTIGNLGPWAPIAHILLFALPTLLFVPGALLGPAGIAFLPRLVRRLRKPTSFGWIEIADLAQDPGESGRATIDVRGADAFVGPLGHIPGASNLTVSELTDRLPELAPLKDQPAVLVCHPATTDRAAAARS